MTHPLSFFLVWRIPNLIAGLSGWWAPTELNELQIVAPSLRLFFFLEWIQLSHWTKWVVKNQWICGSHKSHFLWHKFIGASGPTEPAVEPVYVLHRSQRWSQCMFSGVWLYPQSSMLSSIFLCQPTKAVPLILYLILMAFITGNSSYPLLEGLLAQIHIDLSWRGFGRNRTGDLRITQIC